MATSPFILELAIAGLAQGLGSRDPTIISEKLGLDKAALYGST